MHISRICIVVAHTFHRITVNRLIDLSLLLQFFDSLKIAVVIRVKNCKDFTSAILYILKHLSVITEKY